MIYMDLMKFKIFKKDFSRKVSKTYKAATEKSSKLIEEAKLRLQIANANDKISEKLEEIGALIYEDYKSGNSSYSDFEDLCKEVEEQETLINNMKSAILKFKKLKQCDICENPLSLNDKYCAKCGAEQPEIIDEEESNIEESTPRNECPNCNSKISNKDIYCSNCGIKIS